MCDVCTNKAGTFIANALEKFLGEGFSVAQWSEDGWEEMEIVNTKTGQRFKLSADGDEGGYFHFEPPMENS